MCCVYECRIGTYVLSAPSKSEPERGRNLQSCTIVRLTGDGATCTVSPITQACATIHRHHRVSLCTHGCTRQVDASFVCTAHTPTDSMDLTLLTALLPAVPTCHVHYCLFPPLLAQSSSAGAQQAAPSCIAAPYSPFFCVDWCRAHQHRLPVAADR